MEKYMLEQSNMAREEQKWSLWRIAVRKFMKNKPAVIGLVLLVILLLVTLFAPVFVSHDINAIDLRGLRSPPSQQHILGTDNVGRDVFSRLLYGGRVTILLSVCSMLLQLCIGTVLGAVAGYFGGVVDTILARITDTIMCFPFFIIAMAVLAVLGSGTLNLILVIGLLTWPRIFRVVRAEVMSLKNRDFVLSAKAIGLSAPEIIINQLLPNVFSPIVVSCTLSVAQGILLEASMSFLGLGVQAPQPSWGNMLSAAQSMSILQNNWWLWMPAGGMVVLTALSFNFVGEGLRDALDPHFSGS